MELLLNLAWVLLALPAFWLWRQTPRVRHASKLNCFLVLSCVLVLLFPVISATDDLHALRAEMEEPGPNKHGVRAAADKSPSSHHQAEAALVAWLSLALKFFSRLEVPRSTLTIPSVVPYRTNGRAPPGFSLA